MQDDPLRNAETFSKSRAIHVACTSQSHLQRVERQIPAGARVRRRADAPGKNLRRAEPACARGRDRARRHRACRHVDGRHVRLRGRQSFLRSAGHLGWAFPAAWARSAPPPEAGGDLHGDAGLWYHLGEIETAVRWNIAAVTVVNTMRAATSRSGVRSRLRRRADRAGARAVDLPHGRSRARRDRHRRAWNSRRAAADFPGPGKSDRERKPAIVDVVTDIEAIAPAR